MGKPILTSDLPFATTVCGDAAIYFDPYNTDDIVEKMVSLVESDQLYHHLQKKGTERISLFPSPRERALRYLEICNKIATHSK